MTPGSEESGPLLSRGWASPPLRRALGCLVLFSCAAALSLWPVLTRAGWPVNHEALWWKFRTLVYASHFAQGDPFPIWSSEDHFGLGTPLPFFYHKLFYFVSGLSMLAMGSVKASIVSSLLLFVVLGAWGLYRAARTLGLSPRSAALLAACIPFQGYALFDWLVRGAMAEFAACMIIPWVAFSTATMLRERRVPWHLFTNLLLLAFAHSVIAYFSAILVAIAGILAFGGLDAPARRAQARRALAFAALHLAVVTPWILVYLKLSDDYDVSVITSGGFQPTQQFLGFFAGYLSPAAWVWGDHWATPRTQLNPETLFFLLAAAVGIARRTWARRGRLFSEEPVLAGILISLLAYTFLQLRVSAGVYETAPGFAFLMFPWRLLSIIQVLVLLVIGWWFAQLEASAPARVAKLLPVALLVLSIAGNRSFHPIRYAWYPAERLEAPLQPGAEAGAIGVAGEYLPKIVLPGDDREGPLVSRARRYRRVDEWLKHEEFSFASPAARRDCRARALPRSRFEPLELEYRVECPRPSRFIMRHHYSGLERVLVQAGKRSWRGAAQRTPDDPRARVDVPAGVSRVRIQIPLLWKAIADR